MEFHHVLPSIAEYIAPRDLQTLLHVSRKTRGLVLNYIGSLDEYTLARKKSGNEYLSIIRLPWIDFDKLEDESDWMDVGEETDVSLMNELCDSSVVQEFVEQEDSWVEAGCQQFDFEEQESAWLDANISDWFDYVNDQNEMKDERESTETEAKDSVIPWRKTLENPGFVSASVYKVDQ